MTIVYENVFIGAFVFTLGYKVARRYPNSDPLASVNLYQQTPADPVLADLLANLSGNNFLVEFKRDWPSVITERNKPHRTRLINLLAEK